MKRLAAYDNARGILILQVVLGHVLTYANPEWRIKPYVALYMLVTCFHMSAFFLLSGMLFNGEKWRQRGWGAFLLQKARTLLLPYLFFELVGIAYLHFVLGTVSLREGFLRMLTLRCNVGADWFLPAMFLADLLNYARFRYLPRDRMGQWIGALFAVLCLFSTWIMPKGSPFDSLTRALLGFAFMVFGSLLRKPLELHSPGKTLASFLLTAGFAALTFKFAANDFYGCRVSDPPLFLLCSLAGTSLVLGLAHWIHWRPLAWLGENSIVVMGTHQLALYTLPASSSPLWVVGTFVLILSLELPLIWLLDRYLPFFIGKTRKQAA